MGDRSLLCVLFSSGCCCVPDVRRIIHQSGRGTIAWLSLTYQWPGAARSFACAQPPLHSVRALGSIHPSETVSSSSIESITFRALFSLFVLFFDRLFSLFTSFFFLFSPKHPFFFIIILSFFRTLYATTFDGGDELHESSHVSFTALPIIVRPFLKRKRISLLFLCLRARVGRRQQLGWSCLSISSVCFY